MAYGMFCRLLQGQGMTQLPPTTTLGFSQTAPLVSLDVFRKKKQKITRFLEAL